MAVNEFSEDTKQIRDAYLANKAGIPEVDASDLQWQTILEICLKYPKDAPILDAGCGDGRYMRMLIKQGFTNVTGVDLFDSLDDRSLRYLRADVNALPFADEAFAVVYAVSVINYCRDVRSTINEWKRVIEPGGFLIVTGHTRNSVFTYIRQIRKRFFTQKFPHLRNMIFHDPQEIKTIAEMAGLTTMFRSGFFISWADKVIKMKVVSKILNKLVPGGVKFRIGYHFVMVVRKDLK